jgi:hypothetical protein
MDAPLSQTNKVFIEVGQNSVQEMAHEIKQNLSGQASD